ncbi:MAG: hypothetical protein P1U30_06395, partial [Phycisphaerales bacterium]|nr:hypothetical protein [Phycisphaerales bacterium]
SRNMLEGLRMSKLQVPWRFASYKTIGKDCYSTDWLSMTEDQFVSILGRVLYVREYIVKRYKKYQNHIRNFKNFEAESPEGFVYKATRQAEGGVRVEWSGPYWIF